MRFELYVWSLLIGTLIGSGTVAAWRAHPPKPGDLLVLEPVPSSAIHIQLRSPPDKVDNHFGLPILPAAPHTCDVATETEGKEVKEQVRCFPTPSSQRMCCLGKDDLESEW